HTGEGYSQVLALKVSPDGGRTWDPEAVIVAIPGEVRPAAPVVIRVADRYLLAYQLGGMPGDPVHFRVSADGVAWGDVASPGFLIQDSAGSSLSGTPFLSWSPIGGTYGTLIASGASMAVGGNAVGGGV